MRHCGDGRDVSAVGSSMAARKRSKLNSLVNRNRPTSFKTLHPKSLPAIGICGVVSAVASFGVLGWFHSEGQWMVQVDS